MAMDILMRAPKPALQVFYNDGTKVAISSTGYALVPARKLTELLGAGFTIVDPIFQTDFMNTGEALGTAAAAGAPMFIKTAGTAGAAAYVADAVGGVVRLTLGASDEKSDRTLYMGDQRSIEVGSGCQVRARVRVDTAPTSTAAYAVVGLGANWADGPDAVTESIWFKIGTSGGLTVETDDASTDISVAAGVSLAAGQWHDLAIDAHDPTNIKFYLDDVQIGTASTFAFAATGANKVLQPYAAGYKATGTHNAVVSLDWLKVWGIR